jgi:16S rRNA G1207 methylase RsmC
VTLRVLGIAGRVTMTDRDALAVRFARENAALNGVTDVECHGSLGFDDLGDARFDLIAMNLPAKAGERAIAHLLRRAGAHLAPGGEVTVVAVAAISAFVRRVLVDTPKARIIAEEPHGRYSVLRYGFVGAAVEPPGFESGVYDAGDVALSPGDGNLTLRTVHDVTGEDGPDGATALLVAAVEKMGNMAGQRAVCFNPGQGYGAVAVAALRPARIELAGRDLLALRATARNLEAAGYEAASVALSHVAGFPPGAEPAALICGALREAEGQNAIAATIEVAASSLAPDGALVVAGSSTGVTRVERMVRVRRLLRVERREKRRGASAIVLRRSPG